MAAIQLVFTLRTSPNAKTVHLVGNWDGYKGQLPLSKDKDASKSGSWKGTFRFQQATLTPGKRYWYYYIMDGYHVSHDPAKPFTQEPTTGRKLNILDAPNVSGSSSSSSSGSSGSSGSRLSKGLSARQGLGIEIPTGRGISPSRIIHPKPSKPYASRSIREADYSHSPVDELSSRLSHTRLFSRDTEDDYPSSPSATSSLSSRSGGSSPSSLSSLSDRSASSCRCNRFGITRRGEKVRLDCGGSQCGYSDDSSSCCSDSDDDASRRLPSRRANAPVVKPRISAGHSAPHVQEIRPKTIAPSSRRR